MSQTMTVCTDTLLQHIYIHIYLLLLRKYLDYPANNNVDYLDGVRTPKGFWNSLEIIRTL